MSEKSSIALVGPLPPPYGGYTTYVKLLVDSSQALGLDGYFIVDEAHDDLGRGILRLTRLARLVIRDVLRYRRLLNKDSIRLVHFISQYNWRRFAMHRRLHRVVGMRGLKRIFDIRAGAFIDFCENSSFRKLKQIEEVLTKADVVTVEGKVYVEYLRKKFGVSAIYMPNFVSWAETGAKYEANQNQVHPLVVVYYGRIIKEKGVYDLVEAIGRICHDISVRLDFIGPVRDEVCTELNDIATRYQANDCIRFHGPKQKNELLAMASQGHVFALPTKHKSEGHPNALTEAMALGLVVIACDQGFIKDVLGEAGVMVRQNNPDDIAKSIVHLYNNPQLRRRLGNTARHRAKEIFSDLTIIPKWERLYKAMLDVV